MDGLTFSSSRTWNDLCSRATKLLSYDISPLCGVAQTLDCGTFVIYLPYKPLCGVAETPDCGMLVMYLLYKPFMRCRSDVRLRHALPLFSVISPLCGVAPTPDCGIIILAVSARGVVQTLVWHQYYYFCSFLSRSHSDPRLAPVLLFLQFPLEESFRPSFGTQ